MAIISFDNMEYQQGEAVIWKTEIERNVVKIWFELDNGRIIRETYRTGITKEKDRLKAVLEVVVGDITTGGIDLDSIVGKSCYVELEERPWKEDQPWIGVGKVLPVEPTVQPYSEQSLLSASLGEGTRIGPRKVMKAPQPVTKPAQDNPPLEEESEMTSVQPERKSPLALGGVGGSGNPRTRPLTLPRKVMEAREMLEEEDV
jgi:hypothetical protein